MPDDTPDTIIVDLDGTLADVRHRLHFVRGRRPKEWDAFFAAMPDDPLNVWCRALMVAMKAAGYRIVIVSGRPDSYKAAIRAWLERHNVPCAAMYLRRDGDRREDTVVKREILHEKLRKKDILFVVDDRESVVRMWRREGLICLQCEPHE